MFFKGRSCSFTNIIFLTIFTAEVADFLVGSLSPRTDETHSLVSVVALGLAIPATMDTPHLPILVGDFIRRHLDFETFGVGFWLLMLILWLVKTYFNFLVNPIQNPFHIKKSRKPLQASGLIKKSFLLGFYCFLLFVVVFYALSWSCSLITHAIASNN